MTRKSAALALVTMMALAGCNHPVRPPGEGRRDLGHGLQHQRPRRFEPAGQGDRAEVLPGRQRDPAPAGRRPGRRRVALERRRRAGHPLRGPPGPGGQRDPGGDHHREPAGRHARGVQAEPAPPKETAWVHIALPEGEQSPIAVGGKTESVTLLLVHKGKIDGRDYQDAGGRIDPERRPLRVHDVALRMVPEIHHGPSGGRSPRLQNGASPFEPRSSRSRTASRRTSSASWR